VADPFLQDAIGRETDRILDALSFENLIEGWKSPVSRPSLTSRQKAADRNAMRDFVLLQPPPGESDRRISRLR
jgi:hypothetical protein